MRNRSFSSFDGPERLSLGLLLALAVYESFFVSSYPWPRQRKSARRRGGGGVMRSVKPAPSWPRNRNYLGMHCTVLRPIRFSRPRGRHTEPPSQRSTAFAIRKKTVRSSSLTTKSTSTGLCVASPSEAIVVPRPQYPCTLVRRSLPCHKYDKDYGPTRLSASSVCPPGLLVTHVSVAGKCALAGLGFLGGVACYIRIQDWSFPKSQSWRGYPPCRPQPPLLGERT